MEYMNQFDHVYLETAFVSAYTGQTYNTSTEITLIVYPVTLQYDCGIPTSMAPIPKNVRGTRGNSDIDLDPISLRSASTTTSTTTTITSTSTPEIINVCPGFELGMNGKRALLINVQDLTCTMLEDVAAQAAGMCYNYIVLWSNSSYDVGANLVTTLLYSPYWEPPNGTIGFFDLSQFLGNYLFEKNGSTTLTLTLSQGPYQQDLLNNDRNQQPPINSRIIIGIVSLGLTIFAMVQVCIEYCSKRDITPAGIFTIYTLLIIVFVEVTVDAVFDPFGINVQTAVITTSIYCSMIVVEASCYIWSFYLFTCSLKERRQRFSRLQKFKHPLFFVMVILILLTVTSKVVYYYIGIIGGTYFLFALVYLIVVVSNLTFLYYIYRTKSVSADHRKVLYLLIITLVGSFVFTPFIIVIFSFPTIFSTINGQVLMYLFSRAATLTYGSLLLFIFTFCYYTEWLSFKTNDNNMIPLRIQTSSLPVDNYLMGSALVDTPISDMISITV